MKINDIIQEAVGKIVKGVNTTVDVKPGQTEKEAKKFFGGDGKPKHLGVPGATPNQAFNMGLTESEVTEKVKGPIAVAKQLLNKALHGDKPQRMALELMHKIITKKGTDANHGIGWYADMVARQFPEGIIDVRSLVDAYQSQYGVTEERDIMEFANMTDDEITIEEDVDLICEYGELTEAEYQGRKVELNKPMAGDVKKFKVYVKNDKGNVVKVNFGQKGVRIKKDNPERRKSFRARHNCDNPGPKWKARYWSCRKW